ncbi:MAG TPA: hypothetical protein VN747_00060 [Burkholderiales bacterium]|nr:hypothetical protein [Burkholderiales bacterium]
MKHACLLAAALSAAGCSTCGPSAQDSSPNALWGERMEAFRALADAKNAVIDTHTSPFIHASDDNGAYEAHRKALRGEVHRAQERLDQAECALARARR